MRPLVVLFMFVVAAGLVAAPVPQRWASVQVDRLGDPLPPGAVGRVGSGRFRGEQSLAPDGQSLVTLRSGRACRVDPTTGAVLERYPGPDPAEFESKTFHLSADGKQIAYTDQVTVEVYDVATARRIYRDRPFTGGHSRERNSEYAFRFTDFTGDGKTLLLCFHRSYGCASLDLVKGGLNWKDMETETTESTLMPMNIIADGKTCLGVGFTNSNNVMRFHAVGISAATGVHSFRFDLGEHVDAIDFAAGAQVFVTAGFEDRKIVCYDVPAGTARTTCSFRSEAGIENISITDDGKTVALTCNTSIQVIDAATGKVLHRFTVPTNRQPRTTFSRDGKTLWYADAEAPIWRKFDLVKGREVKLHGDGPSGEIQCLAASPDGRWISTKTEVDGHQLWDGTGQPRTPVLWSRALFKPTPPDVMTFTGDSKSIIATDGDERVRLLDAASGKVLREYRERNVQWQSIVANRTGSLVALAGTMGRGGGGSTKGVISVVDMITGKRLRQCRSELDSSATDLSLSADGRRVLGTMNTHLTNSYVGIFDTATGDLLATATGDPSHALFMPYGHAFIAASGNELHLQDGDTGEPRLKLEANQEEFIDLLAISPDGRLLAGANDRDGGHKVYLWDLWTGQQLPPLVGHDHHLTHVHFAGPDRLVTTSVDGVVLIWDVTTRRGKPIAAPGDWDAAWTDLASTGARAHAALEAMAAAPEQAIKQLRQRIRPAPPVNGDRIRTLVQKLDSPKFGERTDAFRELELLDRQIEPQLILALENSESPEVRQQVTRLLQRVRSLQCSPMRLRELRAVELMERIGTPEALELLKVWSAGDPAARLSQAAKR